MWGFRRLLAVVPLLLAGCCECENGFKVKTEYKYVMSYEYWHASPKDSFLDGAVRTSTSTHNDGRTLTLRCFKLKPESPTASLDLRYTLNVPLLRRLASDLDKAGPVELVITVDGTAIGSLKARTVSHDFGLSFLAEPKAEVADRIAEAKKNIVVMPRQGDQRLDALVEFGVAELAKHFVPVRKACEMMPPPAVPAGKSETTKT